MASAPTYFDTAADFGAWLAQHHASATELVVGYRKVGTGLPSMTWPESVDEALCFGWIDGVRKRIDDAAYQIRFTPRRSGSIWSAVNVAKVNALIAQGRMHPAGLAAFAARSEAKTAVYAFERVQPAELDASQVKFFKSHKVAWAWFQGQAPSYQRQMLHWVVSAKQPETRARRLERLVTACAQRLRLR